jgi:hypothetical protein
VIELHITDTGSINTTYTDQGIVTAKVMYPSEANLPDDIKVKLSVLKLMEDYTDIPDIGQRVTSEVYWIYEGGPPSEDIIKTLFVNGYSSYIKQRRTEHERLNSKDSIGS